MAWAQRLPRCRCYASKTCQTSFRTGLQGYCHALSPKAKATVAYEQRAQTQSAMNKGNVKTSLGLDQVMDEALTDAETSAALIADFDDALDAAIPRGFKPVFVKGLGRFSSKKQKKGTSESRQVGRILAVCKRYNWPTPTWIMLRGVSGWRKSKNGIPHNLDPAKSELGRFIVAAEAGKVPPGTLLIVDNPDRFSRTNLDAADHALMTLLRHGVSVLFLSMQMLLKAGDQDNVEKRKDVMGELNRANREMTTKSKYIRDGINIIIQQAKAGQRKNFGGKVPRWIKWDDAAKDYVPNGEKWTTVCRIVKETIENKTWGQIVNDLNADEVPCLLGGEGWQHPTVYQILRNPALRGDFVIKGETLAGYFPAVITSEAQWNLLQARLAVNSTRGGGCRRSDKIRNLFPGRVVCHRCGMGMRAIRTGIQDDKSYACMGHIGGVAAKGSGKPVCNETRVIKVKAIELDFFAFLVGKMPSTLLLQRDEARQAEIAAIQNEIVLHNGTITRLGRLFAATGIETPELVNDIKAARDRVAALQKQECELLKEARVDIGADAAWRDVIKLLKDHPPTEVTEATRDTLLVAAAKLRVQLADNELRKKLIGPLKVLISSVEIDVKGKEKKYRVELLGGGHTEWRDVSELNAELISINMTARFSDSVRAVQSAKAKARFAKAPMTAEHRAAIARGTKGRIVSTETRALMSQIVKERWAKRRAKPAATA